MSTIVPVILSGGSGTRLWPLSRQHYPKQFLPLVHETTMLQDTVQRVSGLESSNPLVICNEDHRFLVAEQLKQLGLNDCSIILEPVGRNTAPAIAVAALHQNTDDAILLVLAADHVIQDVEKFQEHILQGFKLAQEGAMVTFGILPLAPETGYGYIKAGSEVANGFQVEQFVEKPDLETAQAYLDQGNYFWNSGMFMFRADRYLEELQRFNPDMHKFANASLAGAVKDFDFVRLDKAAFEACPADSIDYAVMEKTDNAVVIPIDVGWNDVGSWTSLWDVSEKDQSGNHFTGDVLNTDSKNNFVHAEDRLVALVGVDDMVVVDTPDALLVASKDRVQEVKSIVSQLESQGRLEAQAHRKVYRPWGHYDSVDEAAGFQVKRITVNPGASLSLQMHHHRAEHWIVVSGTAEVTCGDKVFNVNQNESTYIPLGEKHRLRNLTDEPLEMIEVQSGDYLGEDDIVRFDDVYGRN